MDYVKAEDDLLEQSNQITTLSEYFTWLEKCNEVIAQLEEYTRGKRIRLSIGYRQSLVPKIARLEGAKTRLERQFVHFGGGGGGDYASSSGSHNVDRPVWREIDTAFKNRLLTGAVINANHIEPRQFLEGAASVVLEQVQDAINKHNCVKVNTVLNGEFLTGEKRANKSINTRNYVLHRTTNLNEWYEQHVVEPTLTSLEEFQERDSGWALSRILNLTVNVNKYNPMRTGCHVEVPREIATKKAVISVRSTDDACFAWSVVAALYPAERHVDRQSSYPHYTTVLNVQGIKFPISLKDIDKFEHINDVSINVYAIDEQNKKTSNVLPIRLI